MVKKRGSSSSVTDKKPGTPKVSFKKTISRSKNTKKKPLSPFNKLINKKNNESKKPSWPSQGNIVEDENPREVSKEKKKKTLSKDTKEPKTDKTGQEKNKIKPLKKWSSFEEQTKIRVNTNGAEESVSGESPKNKKPVKLVEKTPVKVSSSLGKTAKKTTKKPVKTIPKKDTKGRKKETGVPEVLVGKSKMPSLGGRKTRKSSSGPKAPSEISTNLDDSSTEPGPIDKTDNLQEKAKEPQPNSGIIDETHSESCSQQSKVNENDLAPDSLVMSSPPEDLSEPIVYGQGGEDEHSLGTNSEPGYQNPDDAEDMSPPLSPSLCTFNFADLKCKWDEYVMMKNAACNKDEDMVSTKSADQEGEELEESDSHDDEAASNSGTEENTELNTSEIQGEDMDMVLTKSVDQEVKELEESESQDDQDVSNSVKEENTELNTSEIEGEDSVTKINLDEEEDKDLVETESQASEDSVTKINLDEEEDKDLVEKESQANELLPKEDRFRMFLSPEKENSSPPKSTIEDDLCLSTSTSQSSSRSSVLSGSVDGLYELHKITKSKKNLGGPLSSKSPLKRKKEVASIGEIQRKRKCLDSTDSCSSSDIVREPANHSKTFEDVNSQISPQYHYRESESFSSITSESLSGLSPVKIMKVVVKRLEEDNGILIGRVPEINKSPRIPIKEAPVLSEKSVVGKQKPLLKTEIQTCKSHTIMDLASSMHTNTNKLNFDQEFCLDSHIKFTLSHEDPLTQNFLQDNNINNMKENKVLDHLYYMGFYVNSNSTDLHFLPEDCSVSLTKIDCKLNDMENVSPTSSLKCSTTKSISRSQTNEIDFQAKKQRTSEKNFQHQILSNKHNTFTEILSNNSAAKDGSRALNSTESRPQGTGKTYSQIVNKQKASAKYGSNIVNLPNKNLQKEEYKSSPGTNNRSIKNHSTSSSFSGFSLQRTLVSTTGNKLNSEVPAKKPKLCKTDLNLKRKQFLKIKGNAKSKHSFNYVNGETKPPVSSTVNSPDRIPNRTIQQVGNLQIPIRKIINTNAAKSESSAEPYFKQPQVHGVRKGRNIITFENNEISRNKPSLSTGNSNVNAIPNVTPGTTVKTYHQNKNYSKTPEDYSVSLTDTLPQSNRYAEDDDTFSILSVDLNPSLRNFVENVLEPDDSRTYNSLRGNPSKKSSTYLENLSTKPRKAAQETSYEKRYAYNGYNESQKQGNERTYLKEGTFKCSQNQFVNSNSLCDDNKDEEEEGELIDKKRVMNRNNALVYRKHIDFRCGTPLKSVTEDQTVFPPSSSKSNSSLSDSNNCYGSDNISYENLLHGTPFDGCCLFYLRNSVAKSQDHQCDLKHEVPDLLFNLRNETEKDELKRSTSKGINRVCKENCNNPPLRLLEGITMFCIKNKQKQELTNVISFLKNSITVDTVGFDKYREIWTVFTKALVKNIVQFDHHPTLAINTFLQTIFNEGGQIREANRKILYDVLGDLSKLTITPSLRLMHCIQFLKDMKVPVNVTSYPISFIEAVLRQVLEKAKLPNNPRLLNDKNSNDKNTSFVYLVYKTFFDNINFCRFIYNESRVLAEKFLNIAADIIGEKVKAKLNQLQIENGSLREPIDPWGLNIQQTNTKHMIRRPDNTVVLQQRRSNFMGINKFPNVLTSQAIKDMAPKEVFDFFKSKGALDYLEMLQKCEDYVKKKLADVTMSFLLLESEKESSWNHCYSLFKELIEFNPNIVKDFTNKNNTPERRVLIIIFCCLKSHHIEDAVDLFTRCGLYKTDSKWLVDKSPEDIALWGKVCQDLNTAFCNLSQFTETEAKLFITIIHYQKSLREPVHLLAGLNNFFWKAANLRAEGCWNAMATLVLAIVEENLLKQLNLDEKELYRILVRAVCVADNIPDSDAPAICARLMKKSNKVCDIYPTSWVRDCHELTIKTCLTVEELYAFFIFKIKAFKKLLELKSLHITFEEYNINRKDWKQPYFRDVDCSIKGAIERFKIACRRIGLEPTSLIIYKNKITVDKVILQGTL